MKKRFCLSFLLFATVWFGLDAQNLAPSRVKKLNATFSSFPFGFTNYNGTLYFFATRDEIRKDNISLWKSDGSEDGTQIVKDNVGFITSGELPQIQVLNNQMFFLTADNSPDSLFLKLWKSDGTENGTGVLIQTGRDYSGGANNATGELTPFNGKLYFNFYDASGGTEPFSTDGTVAGTQILKDLQTGSTGFNGTPSYPHRFTVAGNQLYFWAIPFVDGFGLKVRLYKTDGTNANTLVVKEFGGGLSMITFLSHLVPFGNRIYFSAEDNPGSGFELWSSDGTTAGTNLVKEINPGTNNNGDGVSTIFQGQVFKNRLYFWAFDPATGHELWSTNGTPAGTNLLKNTHATTNPTLNKQAHNSQPFFVFGGKMYYANNDGLKGREPWVTDGTVAGTKLFKDFYTGTLGGIGIWNPGFSVFQGKMYLRAFDGSTVQICRADTLNQTIEKFPVATGFFSSELPFDLQLANAERFVLHEFNGELYFPGGFHPTNGDPFALSHDFGKLAPLPTEVNALEGSSVFQVVPNPGQGLFRLQAGSSQPSGQISVLNGMGQLVWSGIFGVGQNQIEIDLRQQPAGMYWLSVKNSGQRQLLRLVKNDGL
jgi:ELWxxDGT repeat protein